jgi:hypothetical protein
MNHKTKRKWCAALRGDTYEQCFGRLGVDEPKLRCAMGVLYSICDRETYYATECERHAFNWNDHADLSERHAFNWNQGAADLSVGHIVVHLNDNQRLSFRQIADWLEENL